MVFNNKSNNKQSNKPFSPSMATAPYNFVSLPPKPLIHPLVEKWGKDKWQEFDKETVKDKYAEFLAENGKLNGCIELTIKTLSPCFIGGEEKNGTVQFFTTNLEPDGTPVIPGSSVRGMTKNIFKIITCGTLRPNEDFADRHLYFRKIMPATNNNEDDTLHKHYKELISDAKAGFLIKIKGSDEYFICPAEAKKPITIECRKKRDIGGITFHVSLKHDESNYAICTTGEIENTQRQYYITNPDFRRNARIPLEPELHIVDNYNADKTRRGVNIFKYAKRDNEAAGFTGQKDIDFVTPCFYTEKDNYVQSIGHGPHYRVPYLKSISAHIPSAILADDTPIDFADMVFGNKEYWSSRVFFEDARPSMPESAKPDSFGYPRALLSPNPTSYQLYLEQKGLVGKNHWDTPNTYIRGYKLYWHRFAESKDDSWMERDENKIVKNTKKIRPIKKDIEFHTRIRFENLSDVELGALCMSIALKFDGHKTAYKIGMGKGIGMGSITIEPKLILEDMDMHYCQLFADNNDGWFQDKMPQSIEHFIDIFVEHRTSHLSKEDNIALAKSLEELAVLLDYHNKNEPDWIKKTKPMQISKDDKRFINKISLLDAVKFSQVKLK